MSKAGILLGSNSQSCLGTGSKIGFICPRSRTVACGISGESSLGCCGPAHSSCLELQIRHLEMLFLESPFPSHSATPISSLAVTLQSRGWGSKGRSCRCVGEGQPAQEALGALLTGAKTNSLIREQSQVWGLHL